MTIPLTATRADGPIGEEEALAILKSHYGLGGELHRLGAERDDNFHVASGEADYLLKFSSSGESSEEIDAQTKAMLHIASVDPDLVVPRIIPALSGATQVEIGGRRRIARVLTYLHGQPLYTVARSAPQRADLGTKLAFLDRALRDFHHPALDRDFAWDLRHTPKLREKARHLVPDLRRLVENIIAEFETHAAPLYGRLRHQAIHNDINPYNILVATDRNDEVTGIIDFGDITNGPVVTDIAVAAAYVSSDTPDPRDAVGDVVCAFNAALPLPQEERALLPVLIKARLATILAVTAWRASQNPENAPYILKNAGAAQRGLKAIEAIGADAFAAAIETACSGHSPA